MTYAPPTVPLCEVFGPTLQGEGPAAGRPATFVRFGGCNLSCSWCDTPYTWDATRFDLREQITRRPVPDVLEEVERFGAGIVVVTGGEPTMHQKSPGWAALLDGINTAGRAVHLETNGTIVPNETTRELVELAVVSPKLPHADAGQRTGAQVIVPAALAVWAEQAHGNCAVLKVVVQTTEDCERAVDLAATHGFPLRALWLMPEGTTVAALQARWPAVAEFAAQVGCNATHRLHTLAWNDERGH